MIVSKKSIQKIYLYAIINIRIISFLEVFGGFIISEKVLFGIFRKKYIYVIGDDSPISS